MSNPNLKLTFKKKAKQIVLKKRLEEPDEPKTYVFIDGSYFIFRRYCATKVWYSHHTSSGGEDDCHIENEDFVAKYAKHFGDWLARIKKQFKPDRVFWFKDDSKVNVWRTPIFEEYKAHRDDICPPHVGKFFAYSYENLIPEDDLIFVKRCEADDSLAISARYENRVNPKNKIIVFTGDSDYLQLVNDQTRVVNMKGPKLVDIPVEVVKGVENKKKVKEVVDAKTYLTIKVLLGDKTDGISGVNGCGPATAYKLAHDSEYFEKYINSVPSRKKVYEHNLMMISFDSIPDDLKKNIEETYLSVKNNK